MQALRRFPVVVVLGATGAGKSKLALELGRRFNGEIISADSMQVYQGLDIITNKVTPEEQEQCPHHLLGIVHPLQRFTIVDFRNQAVPLIDGLLNRGKLPIIVGGTNYYIEALLWKVLLAEENTDTKKLLYEERGDVDRIQIKRRKLTSKLTSNTTQSSAKPSSLVTDDTQSPIPLHSNQTEGGHDDLASVTSSQRNVDNSASRNSEEPRHSTDAEKSHQLSHAAESDNAHQSRLKLDSTSHSTNQSETRLEGNLAVNPDHGIDGLETGSSSEDDRHSEDEEFEMVDVDVHEMKSGSLHELLHQVDPQMAGKLHPHDRRKIIRSLQVYQQHGIPHSEVIHQQKSQEGANHLGGPLRYQDTCVFWVQTEQTVLDTRLDKRVDQMMDSGLLQELEDFHKEYNEQRLSGHIQEEELYTQGIFQSIGFKEFHQYLILSEEEKKTDRGQRSLEEGIEKLKTATRQYARRQLKWVKNRFLRRGENCPAVYGLDSSNPAEWKETVLEPATKIMEAILEGKEPPIAPLPQEKPEVNDPYQTYVCDVCDGRRFVGHQQWLGHLKSRRHHKRLQKLRRGEQRKHIPELKQTST